MSPQARRVVNRLPRHRREGDILAAATAVFREQGYEQASMAEIAARAGVVEGTIYKYFESKRDLLMQVMAGWYESMLANYAQHLAGIKGTGDRLRYVIWRHLSFIAGNPGLCRVFFREIRSGVEYPNSHLHDLNRRYTSYITDILRDGMASGEFRADLPLPLVRDLVYGTIEHHVWKFVCGHGEIDPAGIADDLTHIIIYGIATPAERADEPATAHRLVNVVARLETVATRLEQQATPREAHP